MKTATLAFLFALLLALGPGGNVDPYHQPLSMFRDGPRWLLGYTLFALLALIGALMVAAFLTSGRHFDAGVFSLGALLLAVERRIVRLDSAVRAGVWDTAATAGRVRRLRGLLSLFVLRFFRLDLAQRDFVAIPAIDVAVEVPLE